MSYSYIIPEEEADLHAAARAEDIDASYKDLAQVCGRIRGRRIVWAIGFLERAAEGSVPVYYATHNKKLGHRRELGGRKGRYPVKAAGLVLKALQSARSNGVFKGLGDDMVVVHAAANKKHTYPRMASKGRTARAYYETARVEIILKSKERSAMKKVDVQKPVREEKPGKDKPLAQETEKAGGGSGPAVQKPAISKPTPAGSAIESKPAAPSVASKPAAHHESYSHKQETKDARTRSHPGETNKKVN